MTNQVKVDVPEKVLSVKDDGADVVAKFYNGEVELLYSRFSNRMRKAMTLEQWIAAQRNLTEGLGRETEVLSENVSDLSGMKIYRRRVHFEKAETKLDVTVVFSADRQIEGFSIFESKVAAESPHLNYKTKTDLSVPWDGEWSVVWGGRTIEKNYHAIAPDQRFALDLLVSGKDGKTYRTDGKSNEDYHAFGRPVYAPGPGRIVAVVNTIDDNVPGTMNAEQPLGNYVIIDHENGEFSFLAHFKKGTVTAKVGDRIVEKKKLGECGNSGNSSEPHIHYHLQDSPTFAEGLGLPIQFRSAMVDGSRIENVELEQSQTVAP